MKRKLAKVLCIVAALLLRFRYAKTFPAFFQ